MGKSKTAQRAARASGIKKKAPPKPKRHPWAKNPKFHQFKKGLGNKCKLCKHPEEVHGNKDEFGFQIVC